MRPTSKTAAVAEVAWTVSLWFPARTSRGGPETDPRRKMRMRGALGLILPRSWDTSA